MTQHYLKVALGLMLATSFTATSALAQSGHNGYHQYQPYKTNTQKHSRRAVLAPVIRQRRVIRVEHPVSYSVPQTTVPLINNLQYNPAFKSTPASQQNLRNLQAPRSGMPVMAPRSIKTPMTIIVDRQAASSK